MTRIEVFADITCPFTHIGLRTLADHRRTLGRDDVRLILRAWPLELVNGAAMTADFVAEEIDELRSQVAPEFFTGFRADRWPASSLAPLRLTHDAYRMSDEIGERVALELRDRLFERGEDVSDPDLLAHVAAEHGVRAATPTDETDPVVAEWELGRERGVIGSPHFFAPGLDMFCPTLHIEKRGEHLHIEWDQAGFDTLVDACFA